MCVKGAGATHAATHAKAQSSLAEPSPTQPSPPQPSPAPPSPAQPSPAQPSHTRSSKQWCRRPQRTGALPAVTITIEPSTLALSWHASVRPSGQQAPRHGCLIPVAQSAPLYPAAHVHVHDPVVPPGVPCVESQTIVPAVMPSPAVHVLAANATHHTIHRTRAPRTRKAKAHAHACARARSVCVRACVCACVCSYF